MHMMTSGFIGSFICINHVNIDVNVMHFETYAIDAHDHEHLHDITHLLFPRTKYR